MGLKATAEPPKRMRSDEKKMHCMNFSSCLGVLGGSAVAFSMVK
jgi:hypothetical protein